ncbi:hypothetical protein SKAU_G00285350 [Synaphobranchus kaupii]|uniref:Uncharacterized protein n=1 Tax=Synaphobranchus kaupii TaxID=118154 RepID=A0A9Q1EXV8_SYNKA|nr:hypothetical protein SKAU_G00285350 [Synaphobranchus kaupii]
MLPVPALVGSPSVPHVIGRPRLVMHQLLPSGQSGHTHGLLAQAAHEVPSSRDNMATCRPHAEFKSLVVRRLSSRSQVGPCHCYMALISLQALNGEGCFSSSAAAALSCSKSSPGNPKAAT